MLMKLVSTVINLEIILKNVSINHDKFGIHRGENLESSMMRDFILTSVMLQQS